MFSTIESFIVASPSAFHAAFNVEEECLHAGFRNVDLNLPVCATTCTTEDSPHNRSYVTRMGGAVVAWVLPKHFDPHVSAFRIVGAHNDSPGLKLKPHPSSQKCGWVRGNVEIYGSPITSTWFDRDLAFAGEVVFRDGSARLVHSGPVARLANVAVHLNRELKSTHSFDPQIHLHPLFSLVDANSQPPSEEASSLYPDPVLSAIIGTDAQQALTWDLISVDTQFPTRIGANQEFIASGRLDNLSSVFPAYKALIAASDSAEKDILVFSSFDHEEVGSDSVTGAGGALLDGVLDYCCAQLGVTADEARALRGRSFIVSADAAHSVHPTYSDKHDPDHHPRAGLGPVIKFNAQQRYATTARSAAVWHRVCEHAGVPVQVFVSHNAVACGSTIGPISSTRLGIPTVDVGVPILSMHSIRELCAGCDILWFQSAIQSFYQLPAGVMLT